MILIIFLMSTQPQQRISCPCKLTLTKCLPVIHVIWEFLSGIIVQGMTISPRESFHAGCFPDSDKRKFDWHLILFKSIYCSVPGPSCLSLLYYYSTLQKIRTLVFPRLFCKYVYSTILAKGFVCLVCPPTGWVVLTGDSVYFLIWKWHVWNPLVANWLKCHYDLHILWPTS